MSKPRNRRNFYFKIEDDFLRNLEKLSGKPKEEAARAAVRAAGLLFRKSAKARVKVHEGRIKTGHYKYPNKRGKLRTPGKLKRSIVFKMNKKEPKGLFSVKDPVGHLVEYGHRTRKGLIRHGLLKGLKKKDKGKGLSYTRAFPFMRPAIVENRAEAKKIMEEILKKFLINLGK